MDFNDDYDRPRTEALVNGNGSHLSSEEEHDEKNREREALLWLAGVANGSIREELKEPYYLDGQCTARLKPDYVLGLTSGELYAAALGNIYRNPSLRNYTHSEILQFLSKKGLQLTYADGNSITETDLGFNRPIRMTAHFLLIEAIMLAMKRDMIVPNGVLKDSARLHTASSSKKTAFAPLPNTTNWLNYSSPEMRQSVGIQNSNELPENNFQPGHPQVVNIRLALEEKRRKLQGEASKKGHEWLQQVTKAGETAFMQFSGQPPLLPQQQTSHEEHVYEEINENTQEDVVLNQASQHRRGKWNEQQEFGAGDGNFAPSAGIYSTRQPPKPLPRRNINSTDSQFKRVGVIQNGSMNANVNGSAEYDSVDDAGSLSHSQDDRAVDEAYAPLRKFLPPEGSSQKPVKFKPKVIRNPTNNITNGSATVTLSSAFHADRLPVRSPVVQREFANSINVLNPDQESKKREAEQSFNDEANGNVSGFDLVDQNDDSDMERKKQKLIMNQLKRRSEQEAARLAKEMEHSDKAEMIRQRQEEAARKREEDRIRRQIVFDQYQKRKAEAKTTDDLQSPQGPPPTMRENRGRGRARPLSVHGSTHTISSVPPPPITENNRLKRCPSQGDIMKIGQEMSILSLHNPRLAAASARHGGTSERRAPSPLRLRAATVTADSVSDAGSSNSGQDAYTGPKLFKKPSSKSNRLITHNAIRDCCLPGIVNEDVQKKVLDALARSDGSHFLVLFRDTSCQFKGLYSYDPDINEAVKIFGTGPSRVDDTMTEKLYKYNSGSKKFSIVPTTHHMSVQIDGITIQSALWYGKKATGLKPMLDMF